MTMIRHGIRRVRDGDSWLEALPAADGDDGRFRRKGPDDPAVAASSSTIPTRKKQPSPKTAAGSRVLPSAPGFLKRRSNVFSTEPKISRWMT